MTYLELINAARQECGVSGPDLTTVIGQVGEMRRFVNWVQRAWTELQLAQEEWRFLNQPFDFVTTAGQQTYLIDAPPISLVTPAFKMWDVNKFRIYQDTVNFSDEMILPFMDYATFRNTYQYGQMQVTPQKPSTFSIDPHKSVLLGGVPDQVYHIRGRYWRSPQVLVDMADVPLLPEYFHMMIVYRVMMKYGAFEAASEVYSNGANEHSRMLFELEMDQLPRPTFGYPLA